MDIKSANLAYRSMEFEERLTALFSNNDANEILVTSSFGASSAILLHMIHKVKPDHPIHFLDTSFHFQETLRYKEQVTELLGLNVITIGAKGNKTRFTQENKTWRYNQDLCCFINKTEPLNQIKKGFKIWISGLMAYQNANRSNINIFEHKGNILKFHPLIDMSRADVELYQLIHALPPHPLVKKGYDSIGCLHCTKKGTGRSGRWAGIAKTECGIHL